MSTATTTQQVYRLLAVAERNETDARVARADIARFGRLISKPEILAAKVAECEKKAARHDRAAAKAREALKGM